MEVLEEEIQAIGDDDVVDEDLLDGSAHTVASGGDAAGPDDVFEADANDVLEIADDDIEAVEADVRG